MNVNPGELNKKIKILKIEPGSKDEDGFPVAEKEITVRETWAKVTNQSGNNLIQANTEFAEVTKRFLVRCTKTKINTDMFIRYRKSDYDIRYINNYGESDEYLEILAKAREIEPAKG